jgi:hypothetical protein
MKPVNMNLTLEKSGSVNISVYDLCRIIFIDGIMGNLRYKVSVSWIDSHRNVKYFFNTIW